MGDGERVAKGGGRDIGEEPLTEAGEELDRVDIGKQFERVKWFLWHGNVAGALDTIEDIEDELISYPRTARAEEALEGRARI